LAGGEIVKKKEGDYMRFKDEYEFLTRHYFFEGDLMLKRNQFFVALNLSLFTILGFLSQDNTASMNYTHYLFPIFCGVGAIISFFWTTMTLRARWYIEARVERIKIIEEQLGYLIMYPHNKASAKWYAKPPTWALFVILGYTFAVSWILLLILFLQA